MAAEATRIEAALPRGARRIALDEHGDRVTSVAARRAPARLAGRRPRRGARRRRPRRARCRVQGELRRDAAPLGPDPCRMRSSACSSPRRSTAPGRSTPAIPITASDSMSAAAVRLPRLAEPAPAPAARPDRRPPRAAARRRRRGRRGARSGRAPASCPRRYVERVTRAKLRAASRRLRARGLAPAPILCADTTVALGPRILGKPRRRGRCRSHAGAAVGPQPSRDQRRRGRRARPHAPRRQHLAGPLRDDHGRARSTRYVAGGEPFGKAGAYAIQSAAAAWIERIEGSYTGIMGLPLHETAALLEWAGVDVRP